MGTAFINLIEDQQKETGVQFCCSHFQIQDYQVATTSTDKALCRKKQADSIQNLSHTPCSLCPSQCGPHSSKCQDARVATTQPSVMQDQEHNYPCDTEKGKAVANRKIQFFCFVSVILSEKSLSYMSFSGPSPDVVRYSKAQRPTSLPIQPFVLVPAGKPQPPSQPLGCLLEQYLNKKSSKTANMQSAFSFKGKSSQSFSDFHPSPTDNHCSIFLEAPSSSDTCSTCTPSPECFIRTRSWNQLGESQDCTGPCTSNSSLDSHHTSCPTEAQEQDKAGPHSGQTQTNTLLSLVSAPSRSSLVRIPTYQDLISLTFEQSQVRAEPKSANHSLNCTTYHSILSQNPPTLTITTDTHHPNSQVSVSPPKTSLPQEKLPQCGAAPAADSGFFHSSFTAALSSVAPLSSLSSLLSLAASGLQIQDSAGHSLKPNQSHHSESLILSDRPPTEFNLSPDTSYESMSISHLQRRSEPQLTADK